jgi:hypothetical protein
MSALRAALLLALLAALAAPAAFAEEAEELAPPASEEDAAPPAAQDPDAPAKSAAPQAPAELPLKAPGPDASEEEQRAYWEARADDARARVANAQDRVAAAEESYQDLRQRKNERGDTKAKITSERDAAAAELEAALRYLEEELPEEARRAGALPGWIRGGGE